MQFEFSRPQDRGLNDLNDQNRGQFRTERPRLPPSIDFEGSRYNLNFQGRKAAASKASEVKTEAGFELSSQSNLLASVFETENRPIIPDWPSKKLVSAEKNKKKIPDKCPIRLPAAPQ